MATITITLRDGIKVGEDTLVEAVIRTPTGGDIIDSQEESEKLVMTPGGPRLVSSPSLAGAGMLRRQVVRIGNLQGPLSREDLARLSPRDMRALQLAGESMENAVAGEALSDRGRDSGAGD